MPSERRSSWLGILGYERRVLKYKGRRDSKRTREIGEKEKMDRVDKKIFDSKEV